MNTSWKDIIREDLSVDTDLLLEIPEFARLKETLQNPVYHAEGNAWEHTMLVVKRAEAFLRNVNETVETKRALLAAALFHDIGKGMTTVVGDDGNWTSPYHGAAGAKIARVLLWDEGMEFRERVCALVRCHMWPLYFKHDKDKDGKILKWSRELGLFANVRDLCWLSLFDQSGTVNELGQDYEAVLKDILWRAERLGALKSPHRPPAADQQPRLTIYVMCGLPGAGKDYLIQHHPLLKDLPVVCRDDIRTEIGLQGEKPFGDKKQERKVSDIAEERIQAHCERGESFIVNQTNLRQAYRDNLRLFTAIWKPRLVLVYREAPSWADNLKRREGQIPVAVMENMRKSFEFPTNAEFDEIVVSRQDGDAGCGKSTWDLLPEKDGRHGGQQ